MSISISVEYVAEIERLRHDIERHIAMASELATENERLRAENTELLTDLDRVLTTLRYLIGIAERGEGRPMAEDETAERFVLGYVKRLEAELERERMRLAACGVVAMANTPESAARARDIHPDYRSASCDDVARAVDSEMSLRAELAEARTVKESLIVALKQYGKHSVEGEPCPVCEAIDAAMAGGEK